LHFDFYFVEEIHCGFTENRIMAKGDFLGEFEQLVLLAVAR